MISLPVTRLATSDAGYSTVRDGATFVLQMAVENQKRQYISLDLQPEPYRPPEGLAFKEQLSRFNPD